MKNAPKATFSSKRYKDPHKLKAEVDRRIAAGVGQGIADGYDPWLKIGSFASRGVSYAVPSAKCARSHHFFSKNEYHFYLLQEFADNVLEIREQFPLINYGRTFQIAVEKGYRPSFYRGTTVPRVYTTDFMLTKVNAAGESYLSAVSIKSRKDHERIAKTKLGLKRTIQLAEIERTYWNELGVYWDTVFAEDMPIIRIKNIESLRTHARIKSSICSDRAIIGVLKFLLEIGLPAANKMTLKALIRNISKCIYMSYLDTFELFMYMAWHKYIGVNINDCLIRVTKPLEIVAVNGKAASSELLGVA